MTWCVSCQHCEDIVDDVTHRPLRSCRSGGGVGCEPGVLTRPQRRIARQGFRIVYVQERPRIWVRLQKVGQRLGVYDHAPAGVDQDEIVSS